MIVCKSCGQVYDDGSTYCNRCHTDLDTRAADQVYDIKQLAKENIQLKKQKAVLIKFTVGLMVILPFFLYWFDALLLETNTDKVIFLLVYEIASVLSLFINSKNHSAFLFAVAVLAILIAMLFPYGLMLSAAMFYLIFQCLRLNE